MEESKNAKLNDNDYESMLSAAKALYAMSKESGEEVVANSNAKKENYLYTLGKLEPKIGRLSFVVDTLSLAIERKNGEPNASSLYGSCMTILQVLYQAEIISIKD